MFYFIWQKPHTSPPLMGVLLLLEWHCYHASSLGCVINQKVYRNQHLLSLYYISLVCDRTKMEQVGFFGSYFEVRFHKALRIGNECTLSTVLFRNTCVGLCLTDWPANVMRTSQFSVGTVFIQDLCDMMCLPAWSSLFPNNLSAMDRDRTEERLSTWGTVRGFDIYNIFYKPCR